MTYSKSIGIHLLLFFFSPQISFDQTDEVIQYLKQFQCDLKMFHTNAILATCVLDIWKELKVLRCIFVSLRKKNFSFDIIPILNTEIMAANAEFYSILFTSSYFYIVFVVVTIFLIVMLLLLIELFTFFHECSVNYAIIKSCFVMKTVTLNYISVESPIVNFTL